MKRAVELPEEDSVVANRRGISVIESGELKSVSTMVALLWLIGFSFWFYHFGMPNNPGLQRWMLWIRLPYDMLDLLDPPVVNGNPPWSWLFLLERVPFSLIGVFIWAGAWGLGSLLLRLIRINLRGCEAFFFSICLGLSGLSLTMLLLGLGGIMSRWPPIVIISLVIVTELICRRLKTGEEPNPLNSINARFRWPSVSRFSLIIFVALIPIVLGELIGAMSPQNDFDVVEYHLGGPKEWFQQGRIARLPHNVYTSFPFLSEMLTLTGMVIYGDWQWGALAGQAAIAGFAPLTAIGVFAAGRRWFSEQTGAIAALVYLSSPWTYRFTIIAYAEGGLSCYLFAALYAALLFKNQFTDDSPQQSGDRVKLAFLAGLLSGSAMACKYTGLVLVVIPVAMILVWTIIRRALRDRIRQLAINGLIFSMGVAVAVGPWLLKNTIETGNPVYPLAVRIFGGIDRDEQLDAKWRRGHANNYQNWKERLVDLPVKLTDVMANNDWHSPLLFALAPLSLLLCQRRRETKIAPQLSQSAIVGVIWFYAAWQFANWWLLTHHIDRFYVPMFSAVALLAGIGTRWWEVRSGAMATPRGAKVWNGVSGIVITASVLYSVNFMQHGICGFNAGRLQLKSARDIAVATTAPRLKWMNDEFEAGRLPSQLKVLYVGEALLFHARYPYLYNTVFDHSLFEQFCGQPKSIDHELRPADEILTELRRRGITHVDVCWEEILRYRRPGSYGYTDFVQPERFAALQKMGVLGPPLTLPAWAQIGALSEDRKKQLDAENWTSSLTTTFNGAPAYFTSQIFPVLDPN